MKIVVIARTLNEEKNVERFCTQYSFADKILLADGGSTDKTLELLKKFPKVEVRNFPIKYPTKSGEGFMNPEGLHTNFLIDWATNEEKADWIILDDSDCWPNKKLKKIARSIFERPDISKVLVYRLYIYKDKEYFPDMSKPGQSLWGWRPDKVSVRCKIEDPYEIGLYYDSFIPGDYVLDHPFVLLHNFAQSDEMIKQKIKRYTSWGRPYADPKDSCGPLAPLPKYARI